MDRNVNFKDPNERKVFEEEMSRWKNRRQDWTWGQTIVWVLQLFGINFGIIIIIYSKIYRLNRETDVAFCVNSGLFTYIIITDAVNEKLEKEEMMREEWLRNRNVTVKH